MKTLEALQFKVELTEFLDKYRKGHTDTTVWECYFSDCITWKNFSEFLGTKTGQKWLDSSYGRTYLTWQKE